MPSKYIYDPKLVGKHSKFCQKLYEKYDIPARNLIKKKLGDYVKDNDDIYKQDLIITDKNSKYRYLELQVCATWTEKQFPFSNMWIYERKGHYGINTLYLTLNRYMTRGYVFDANSIKRIKPRRFKKYSREFVYDIPWNKIMPVYMDNFDVNTLKLY